MKRGFKCKEEILDLLKKEYDLIVLKEYNGEYLKSIQQFDLISEGKLRNLLDSFYKSEKSKDQAWKTCKGSLYEYSVFKCVQQLVMRNGLDNRLLLLTGDEALYKYKNQIAIQNWSYIFPDIDIVITEKSTNSVKAIISCKTSLRERITETAFWKRELERNINVKGIKIALVTTDKDDELRMDTNRYILLHVIDYTFVTDPDKYKKLIETYRKKYGRRDDFNLLLSKVRFIEDIKDFLNEL